MYSTRRARDAVQATVSKLTRFLVTLAALLLPISSIAAPYHLQAPNSIRVGQPFATTITATDSSVTSNELSLSAVETFSAPSIVISELNIQIRNIEFTNVRDEPVDLSGWRVYLYDSRSNSIARASFEFPNGSVCPPYGVFQVQIRPSAPTGAGNYPLFTMIQPQPALWQQNQAAAVLLVSPERAPVDILQAGIDSVIQPSSGVVELWRGELLPVRNLHTRAGAMNHFSTIDWRGDSPSPGNLNVAMLLPFIQPEEMVSLHPSSITITNGVWSGDLVLNEDSLGTNLVLRADDLRGNASDSSPVQVISRFALSLEVPNSFREGSIAVTGKVSIPETLSRVVTVQFTSSDFGEISVPSSVEIPAGAREASFTLNSQLDGVLDGTVRVIVTAQSFGFGTASATILHDDLQTTRLHVEVPTEVLEGGGLLSGIVRADNAPAEDVEIILATSNRLELPSTVVLKAGTESVTFPIGANDDLRRNGDEQIEVRAEVEYWTPGTAFSLVKDNELTSLSFLPGPPVEEGSTNSGDYVLVLGGTLSTNLTVALSCEPAGSLLSIPATVIVPAGAKSISLNIVAPDNSNADGARSVTLRANAPGFNETVSTVQVLDNEVHRFAIVLLPLASETGTPLPVGITALDDIGRVLTNRQESLQLTAGTAFVTVLSNGPPVLTNGLWQGFISLAGVDSVVSIQVQASGVTSQSAPFILQANNLRNVSLEGFSSNGVPEMVAAPSSGKLFLLSTNGIASVDPLTATLQTYAGVPGGRHLVVTDNGQFLYWASAINQTAQVTRFDAAAGSWTNYPLAAPVAALQVVPGAPRRFVAATALITPPSSWNYGAFMFEDGNPLPEGAGFGPWGQSYTSLVFDGPNTLLGYEGHVTSYRFARHAVSTNGITFVDVPSAADGLGPYDLQIANGMVYGLTGIFNPLAGTWVNRFPFEARPWIHSQSQQLVVVEPSSPQILRSFDLQMETRIGSLTLPASVDTRSDYLAFWGTDGVALLNETNLFLFQVPFFSTNAAPDLTIQINDAIEPAHTNSSHSLKLIVSNAGAALARDVLVRYSAPTGAILADVQLPTNAFRFDNTVTFYVEELNANETTVLEVSIIPITGTALQHVAEVATASTEPILSNNEATEVTIINSDFSVAEWSLGGSDLVWDQKRKRLYTTIADGAHPSYGWIVALDVSSQSYSKLAFVGFNSGTMALSDDGRFLYVVTANGFTVRRLDLESLQIDSEFSILSHIGPVKEIAPIPGRPRSVAINFASIAPGVIYDDGIQRSGVTLPAAGLVRPGDDLDVVIATESSIPTASQRIMAPPGSDPEITFGNVFPNGDNDLLVEGGLIFSSSGLMVDAVTQRLLGIFPGMTATFPDGSWKARQNQRVSADLENGLVYFLEQTENGVTGSARPTIHAFKLSDLSEVGSFTVPNLVFTPKRFVLCDRDTFAILKWDGQILICGNPFTNSVPTADISVVHVPTLGPNTLGESVSFQIAVTNLGPGVATNVVLRNALPAETSLLDIAAPDASVGMGRGFVEISWDSLTPGEGRLVTVTASLITARELKNAAFAFADNLDPDLDNNLSHSISPLVLSRMVNLQPSDVVFDAAANRLLLSVGNSGDRWSNSIVSVDPVTGERQHVLRTEFEPSALAVSDDGKYLYATTLGTNLVLRIDLTSLTNDLRIQLKTETVTQSPALGVVTVPGQPESIIVSSAEAAVVYDGAVPRAGVVTPSHQVVRGDAPDIFYQIGSSFRRLQLTAAGLSVVREANYPTGGAGAVTAHDGVLTIASGHVMSGVTGEPLGQASLRPFVSGQQAIQGPGLFDPDKGAVMFLASPRQAFFLPGTLLAGYSTNDFQEQWTAFIPDVSMYPGKFIHAGPGRAAIIAYCSRPGFTCPGSQLVLLNLNAIPSQPIADLKLTVTVRTNLIVGSHLTMQSTVVNAGPWALTGGVLQVQIPPGLEFLQGNTSSGSIISSDSEILVEVGNLKSSEGAVVDLTFLTTAEGSHTLNAEVAHSGQDLVASNNETNLLVTAGPLPTVSIVDATMSEGIQSQPPRLVLSHAIPEPVRVQLAVRDGTAVLNSDFTLNQLIPTIPAGATSAPVQVLIREDQLVEGVESFVIELLSATNATLADVQGTVTILDNDTYRVSVVSSGAVTEGDVGSTNALFQVTLMPPAPEPVRVSYATGAGTAASDDYEQKRGTLLFSPGVTNVTLSVPIFGDNRYEADETFALILQNPAGAQLVNGSASVVIRNDDEERILTIQSIVIDGETVTIHFDAVQGETYTLQWREHLDAGNWIRAGDPVVAPEGFGSATHSLTNVPAGSRTGFYRISNE